MIVAVTEPQSCWEAFQASFVLKRAHKRLNRTVIEAIIRERLELAVAQKAAWWLMSDGLAEGCHQVEAWMKEQLLVHGLELASLELVGVPRTPRGQVREDLVPLYQESWLDQIPTADGFHLNLSAVVRTWVPASVAGQGHHNILDDDLRHLACAFFGELDAETALRDVPRWQESLRPLLDQLEGTYRTVAGLLAATRSGVLREDPGIVSDTVWITRRQLKSSPRAFQPGQRYGYLDPYQLFFMLKDRKQLHERYRLGKG
jgi:hypothetical protein